MSLTNDYIQQRLEEQFPGQLTQFEEPYGMLTFEAPRELNLKVMQFLFEDPELSFRFLTDLTAVHYPAYTGRELAVVYHLHNLVANVRIRFKVYAPIAQPDVFSATKIFMSANWQEREAFDFYGVNFVGHPNLKRIQNVDEMDYFPLRKEFPLEDQTRIDKDDEMFGRGGSFDFGNRQEDGAPRQIPDTEQ
ncbi:NADH dehydrogenase subunit C [Cnuella takakiae]|uniref:NADH dehydrogenase subunit C n=1 Tax=Cnuella takakiae TaxID=1302690 RepID=A0A1M4X4Q7_9BACT|nr:NADH-quinone oxidoreductase subunit C [Cnuella takakiae]OLY91542.1 NADH dehydrogenase [Cnuella takakiae]SHE88182.1 NADH dehydrogenase subunit C [Cnuella takakiae]